MTNKKRIALLLAVMMVLSVTFTGCNTYDNFLSAFFVKGSGSEDTIKIGVFEPMTGSDSVDAADEVKGIELAHELFGVALDKKVELVYGDNQSDVTAAKTAATYLVEQGVSVVLGSYRSVLSLAGGDIFAEAGIPAIGITCTNPIITQTNEYYFRVCFIDAFQGNSAAKYLIEDLEQKNVACLKMEGDDYAAAMIEQFQAKFDALDDDDVLVTTVEYPEGTTDFTAYIKQLVDTGATSVFFPCTAAVGDEVIYQATEAGAALDWIGCDKWSKLLEANQDPLRDSTEYLDGVSFVSDFDAEAALSEMTQTFLSAYAAKYGTEEKPTDAVALGFDAYLVALEGITEAGNPKDGTAIASSMKSIFELSGATGNITMNSQGDPIKDVLIEKYNKGNPDPVYTATPNWGE